MTSRADGENIDSPMQLKTLDNVSAGSGRYPCKNLNELQLCCAKGQALTSHRPEDSHHLTDASSAGHRQ